MGPKLRNLKLEVLAWLGQAVTTFFDLDREALVPWDEVEAILVVQVPVLARRRGP